MRQALHAFHCYFEAVFLDLGDALVYLRNQIWRRGVELLLELGSGRQDMLDFRRQVEALKQLNQIRLREYMALPLGRVMEPAHEVTIWQGYYLDLLAAFAPQAAPVQTRRAADYLAVATADPRSFDCFADVIPALSLMAANGVSLGIISNAYPSARAILRWLDLEQWFDVVLLSNETGCAKPAAEVYQSALDLMGVRDERAIYLDDRARYLCLQDGSHLPLHATLLDRGYGWLEPDWRGPVLHSLAELNTVAGLDAGLSCPLPPYARVAA